MIVMKFGGTSIADAEAIIRVINIIKSNPEKKVVVVSAIAEGTNILTRAFLLAHQNKTEQQHEDLIKFKMDHLKIVEKLITDKDLLGSTKTKIETLFIELEQLLKKISLEPKNRDRNLAKTLAFGELLSSTLIYAAMIANGIKSSLIDARDIIITNNNHLQGEPILEQITKIMPPIINRELDDDQTVITQGFISGTTDGETTTLGREGSDYSASLIGTAINATQIQIWTDVPGIMTGDPKKIKNVRPIPSLSFDEAADLSALGAKVIHPSTIEPEIKP